MGEYAILEINEPGPIARRGLWQRALDAKSVALPDNAIDALAARYDLP